MGLGRLRAATAHDAGPGRWFVAGRRQTGRRRPRCPRSTDGIGRGSGTWRQRAGACSDRGGVSSAEPVRDVWGARPLHAGVPDGGVVDWSSGFAPPVAWPCPGGRRGTGRSRSECDGIEWNAGGHGVEAGKGRSPVAREGGRGSGGLERGCSGTAGAGLPRAVGRDRWRDGPRSESEEEGEWKGGERRWRRRGSGGSGSRSVERARGGGCAEGWSPDEEGGKGVGAHGE